MGARGTSRRADIGDDLTAPHLLSNRYGERGGVPVARHDAATMVHIDHVAVPAVPSRRSHNAVGGRNDGCAHLGGDINALMELTLKYPGKRIVIVWDNAKWHTSKHLRSHLGQGNPLENIHLINLPPYNPDHNPIEHVWAEAKNNISNEQRDTFNHTRQAFEEFITKNKFPYRINKDFE